MGGVRGSGWTQYVYFIGGDDDEVFAVEVYVHELYSI